MEKIISGLFSGNSGYQLVIQQRRCYGHWVCGSFKYRLFLKRNPTFFKWLLTILSVKYTNCHPSWMKISSPNYFLKFSWASIKPHCLIPLQINVIIFLTNLSNTESGVHVRICDILNGWGWLGFFFFPVKKKSPCLNSMVFCWKVFFFFLSFPSTFMQMHEFSPQASKTHPFCQPSYHLFDCSIPQTGCASSHGLWLFWGRHHRLSL